MREFTGFNKIPRLSRECIVTEKIDGTNAQVCVVECDGFAEEGAVWEQDGIAILAGSRTRWITPEADNYGFAAWVRDHGPELAQLGAGSHFGEWWGSGIQRGYGFSKGQRFFSLFNTGRWNANLFEGNELRKQDQCNPKARPERKVFVPPPACCHVVPVLYAGEFFTVNIEDTLTSLQWKGSQAAPGFMKPEGIVIYHVAGNYLFKKTIEKDNEPKGNQ